MFKKLSSASLIISTIISLTAMPIYSKTVIFYEIDFPAADNSPISKQSLERALAALNPVFLDLNSLRSDTTFAEGDLLVLPYGSAFPEEAWGKINQYISRGNLLVLGGRPLLIPVKKTVQGWSKGNSSNAYSRALGIFYSYEVPLEKNLKIQPREDAPFFNGVRLNAKKIFVNSGYMDKYRGLVYMVNSSGDRVASPVAAEDLIGYNQIPGRRVYLNFEAEKEYWNSEEAIELIRKSAVYASRGGVRLWIDIQQLAIDPGSIITGSVNVVQKQMKTNFKIELLKDSKVISERSALCDNTLHQEIGLPVPLKEPGLYRIRLSLSSGDTLYEQYSSGIFVRDSKLLQSGYQLEAGRDYFRVNGKPFLPIGVNYFSTDLYTSGFFVGGSIGGNAWVWEKDFAEMERLGFNTVRTGIWLNRINYLDPVTGSASERLLSAIEAYLHAAAKHNMQVIFTFFAFDPQTEMQAGHGQETGRLGPGSNPYIDPVSIAAQTAYVKAIVSRFFNVPFLSFDLINEPSFNNPKRLWRGNSPNGDPSELSAWQNWLKLRYGSVDSLGEIWRVPSDELGSFDKVPLPSFEDLEIARYGNSKTVRAVDFNHFAQDAFSTWVNIMIKSIREAGGKQLVTVGQDEGGVADRLLNHFWVESDAAYTSNHTWWRDDALLWGSAAAKTPFKPNLIGETGIQPVWSMDGTWRWDEIKGTPLMERKLALGFANANAGVLYWDWTRTDPFGIMRRDGSYRQWLNILKGIAEFVKNAEQYTTEAVLPEIAVVLPHSLQLSVFGGNNGIEVQQKSLRALYHYARSAAFTISEYQIDKMPDAKLIIVPAPWIFSSDAWSKLMNKVKEGAVLLISGRIDADEHWIPDPQRIKELDLNYSSGLLSAREAEIVWPGGKVQLTFSGDKTTYGEQGFLENDKSFEEISLGKGRILFFTFPLERADQLDAIGKIYEYAIDISGVKAAYETSINDPGILIAPTRLPEATLYVLTSESASKDPVIFKDLMSGKTFKTILEPGMASLVLIDKSGNIKSSYSRSKIEIVE